MENVNIAKCSFCGAPAHASETDDADRCAACQPSEGESTDVDVCVSCGVDYAIPGKCHACYPAIRAYRDPAIGFRLVCAACYVEHDAPERSAMMPADDDVERACDDDHKCYPCGAEIYPVTHCYPPPHTRDYQCRSCGDDWRPL